LVSFPTEETSGSSYFSALKKPAVLTKQLAKKPTHGFHSRLFGRFLDVLSTSIMNQKLVLLLFENRGGTSIFFL
jgi:hypothetical protein